MTSTVGAGDEGSPGHESAATDVGATASGDSGSGRTDEPFPRGLAPPRQSPLFWVAEKDRYLRQLMIRDVERLTKRRLLVYFAHCESHDPGAQILPSDDVYLAELLGVDPPEPTDLLIETDGGSTDATEKLVALLRSRAPDLRVIVPRRAKSNGTLLALAAQTIVMGVASELGPIDPLIDVSADTRVPAHVLIEDGVDPLFRRTAQEAISQTRTLARTLLETGMLSGRDGEVEPLIDKLANRQHYHSHGSVIGADEASGLGLSVVRLPERDPLWGMLWLLRCMYAHDLQAKGHVKVFEGRVLSNTLRTAERARPR